MENRISLKKTIVPASFYTSNRTPGVYGLRDPETGAIRYIGESEHIEKRYAQHVASARLGSNAGIGVKWMQVSWILELRKRQLRPDLVIIQAMPDASSTERVHMKKQVIAMYRELLGDADLNLQLSGRSALQMLREVSCRK